MVAMDVHQAYDLALGLLAGVGMIYLLYLERFVRHRRSLLLTVLGLFTFAVGGPLFEVFLSSYVHLVHSFAAILVVLGLYDPVHNDLRTDEWAELLLRDPSRMRLPAEWMTPMDDDILELFHSSDLVLTPSIIAYNIEYSREEVNRRLSELESHDVVERVDRGKYRITEVGEEYLAGRSPPGELEPEPNGADSAMESNVHSQ